VDPDSVLYPYGIGIMLLNPDLDHLYRGTIHAICTAGGLTSVGDPGHFDADPDTSD